MKPFSTTTANQNFFRKLMIISGLMIMLLIPVSMFAQTDSTKTDSAQVVEEAPVEESSLISPSAELISVQKSDQSIDLKASLKAKVKGTFYILPLLKITFIQVTDTAEKVLGFVITDKLGKAVFNVKADQLKTDKEGKLHYKIVFAGNKQMDPADAEVTIKRARLEITPVKEDSLLTVKVKLIDMGTGTEIPVPETVLGIFVKRLFNPLKVGEGTTDENGEATVEIPQNLPGNAKGNITLMVKLDENETYGNLEASVDQKWGIPVSVNENHERTLWSSDPPIWMLVTFIILMTIVWGHYIVIVFQMLRLRKEEPDQSTTAIIP